MAQLDLRTIAHSRAESARSENRLSDESVPRGYIVGGETVCSRDESVWERGSFE